MQSLISVSAICERLERLARANGLTSLSMWLKLAANDAYLHNLKTEALADDRIGIFDWDIANDICHANLVLAEFFGLDPPLAARGLPVANYIASVHPDDMVALQRELDAVSATGRAFSAEYRIIAGSRTRWVKANGICTIDDKDRPIRLLGSAVDITSERSVDNVVLLRP